MRELITLILFLSFSLTHAQEVVTVAGMLAVTGASDGPAFEATFNNPHGLAIDASGNVYIVDRFGHKVRKYTQDGTVSTFAGSGIVGNADGIGLSASFNEPWGICVGNDGNIYVADTRNNLIRKITPSGIVTTLAGSGLFGTSNGQGVNASFGNPTGIEMDEDGNLYVADHLSNVIRRISPSGYVTTIAGVPNLPGYADGVGSNALFNRPYGLTLDNNGDILVADEWNHRIRRVTPSGEVTTVAGTGDLGHVNGVPSEARFNYPWDLTVDDQGRIFVADGNNHVIRKLSPTGSIPESYEVTTYAGNPGESGGLDGYGFNAEFNAATSVHYWEQTGEIYVADAYNDLIRKIVDANRPPISLQMNDPIIGNPNGAPFCKGMRFELEVSTDFYSTYAFYVNNEVRQNGPSINFSTTDLPVGNVTVTAIGTDAIGSVVSNTIDFVVEEIEILEITADETQIKENNNIVVFEASVSDADSLIYDWDFGDPDSGADNSSALEKPEHAFSGPGIYSISLIVENTNGCRDTIVVEDLITYLERASEEDIFIPNAFSPNNDGNNDFLFVRGEGIEELEFSVYNQWGQVVFETNSVTDGWDGNFKGKPASSCTYTFLAKAKMTTGKQAIKTGHVSIIR